MIKMMMHGCNGRMGKMITQLCKDDSRIQIVAGIDARGGLSEDYPIYEKVEDCLEEVDVIVDFSKRCFCFFLFCFCLFV